MKKIEVVAAVIRKDNMILATQRGYGEFKGGWEFPGGKIEAKETNEEALIREIKEELDMKIKVHDLLQTVYYEYPTFYLTMHCYWCTMEEETFILKEHEDYKWLNKKTLRTIEWLPADLGLIDEIEKELD